MKDLERLAEILTADEMVELNKRLTAAADVEDEKKRLFLEAVYRLNSSQDAEKFKMVEKSAKGAGGGEKTVTGGKAWSSDELSLLVKGVNLFPAGTTQRWEVVANFIMQHTKTPELRRHAKETLGKAKELQSGDFQNSQIKEEANKNAYENLEKLQKRVVKVS
jgi:DnaJ family protein C protein 2